MRSIFFGKVNPKALSGTMETRQISQEEVDSLLVKIKDGMSGFRLPLDMIEGTRIVVIHPEYWEISLLVPYKSKIDSVKAAIVRKVIETILFNQCGANPSGCDYFGKQTQKQAYEWYFRHPNIPQDVNDLIEAEIEAELGNEIGLGLPIPNRSKSKSDTAFITIKDEFFREIESGRKTTEYRNLNQYYCNKFFSSGVRKRYLKLNSGYLSGDENQMVFEIAGINLVSEDGREIPAVDGNGKPICSYSQLPKKFAPVAYGIKLGKRVA